MPARTSSRSSQRPNRVRLNNRLIRASRVRGASAEIVPSSVPTTISLCWAELVANWATAAINNPVKTVSPRKIQITRPPPTRAEGSRRRRATRSAILVGTGYRRNSRRTGS